MGKHEETAKIRPDVLTICCQTETWYKELWTKCSSSVIANKFYLIFKDKEYGVFPLVLKT